MFPTGVQFLKFLLKALLVLLILEVSLISLSILVGELVCPWDHHKFIQLRLQGISVLDKEIQKVLSLLKMLITPQNEYTKEREMP
jgi:hypothetical protein